MKAAVAAAVLLSTLAAAPATRPDAADDILGLSKPATQPASQPAMPAGPASRPTVFNPDANDGETRTGTVTLNDGTTVRGRIATTAERPVRIWVEAEKQYEDVPLSQVKTVEAKVAWERDEREWNFKDSGSDIKVYSGRTYPARETAYAFTLTDGTVITGATVAPLYVTTDAGRSVTLALHKRDKGHVGQTLKQLVYVTKVELN